MKATCKNCQDLPHCKDCHDFLQRLGSITKISANLPRAELLEWLARLQGLYAGREQYVISSELYEQERDAARSELRHLKGMSENELTNQLSVERITNNNLHTQIDEMTDQLSADLISDDAKDIKQYAQRIKEEMDIVITFAEVVMEQPNKTLHFQLNPSDLTAWRNLPRAIARIDGKIQEFNNAKSILRGMGITEHPVVIAE